MQNQKTRLLPLDLQLFAEEGGATGGDGANETNGNNAGNQSGQESADKGKGEKVSFSPEQQEYVNRLINQTIAKERSKWEKDFETRLNEAKTEAEKLAKMNAEQKAEYERQKREEALAKREQEITRRELRATALETLAEKGLPKQLADILDYTDAESTNKSIESVEKVFREAVEAAVNERLKGGAPKGGTGGGNNAIPDAEKIKQIFNKR